MKFKVTFKKGITPVSVILPREDYDPGNVLTIADDVAENVIRTEQFLERLTGYRVHIEQVS